MDKEIETIENVNAEKKYNLRALGAKDVFSMSRIISKVGLKNFKRCFQSDEIKGLIDRIKTEGKFDDKNIEAVGAIATLEIADVLFENLPNCEKELFAFLADLAGMKVAEVELIPPADFLSLVIEVVTKPEFADFFKVALRLLK